MEHSQERVLSPELIELAHQYFRKIHIKFGKYQYTGGGRGYHKPSVFIGELKRRMIEDHVSAAELLGATDITRSMSTHSVYYKLQGKEYRVSDHRSATFQGEQVIISLPTHYSNRNSTLITDSPAMYG